MAAGQAKLLRHGRVGSIGADGVRYEAVFQVITTDKSDGPAIVALASGIPRYGDIYAVGNELDFGINCNSILPRQSKDSPFIWEVTVTYTASLLEDPEQINQPNPTLRPAIIHWLKEEYTEPMERDRDGTVVATVNNEPFVPRIERVMYRPVVHIERNFLAFNDSLQFTYLSAVNSDTWLGGTADKWLCRMLQVDPMFENNIRYKRVTAEFVYNKDEWTVDRLNRGHLYHPSTASTALLPSREEKILKLDGTIWRSTDSTTDIVYLSFYPYAQQPFNALGLV
jgi:hypothetical protein